MSFSPLLLCFEASFACYCLFMYAGAQSAGRVHKAAPSASWSFSWEGTSNSRVVPHTSSTHGCIPGWRVSRGETACQHPLWLPEPSNRTSYKQDHPQVLYQPPSLITLLPVITSMKCRGEATGVTWNSYLFYIVMCLRFIFLSFIIQIHWSTH